MTLLSLLPLIIPLTVLGWAGWDMWRVKRRWKAADFQHRLRAAQIMFTAGQTEAGNENINAVIEALQRQM